MGQDRAALEQTIGQLTLKRLSKQRIGSASAIYKKLGGTDGVVVSIFDSFGPDWDAFADAHTHDEVLAQVKTAFHAALAAEGKNAPSSDDFKDLVF
jgi:hypothetical protein